MGITARPLTYTAQGKLTQPTQVGGKGFGETLKDSMQKVSDMQTVADKSVADLAVGRGDSLHETMIAVEQAGIAFKMMMAVRGKVINAYHEVMRMQF
jgi:flagellar hook-basal body complex protein FliE